VWGVDLDRFYRLGISSEHGDEHVVDDLELGLVCRGDFDENILGAELDFAVLAVDDGR
jgi:hypothetical protein